MCYAGLENKISRVETLSREIVNTHLIRQKGKTLESQNNFEKLVNISWSLF